jgi:hypothetical protein
MDYKKITNDLNNSWNNYKNEVFINTCVVGGVCVVAGGLLSYGAFVLFGGN